MSRTNDQPAPARSHDPTASCSLLPVLLWINRRELASRFPDWHPDAQPTRTTDTP
ncbi:MAG: hypothetical protein KDK70_16635 [Myxococcales bacterium]|nr:hypothetical protein [Myxococcales bacterium]